MAADDCINIGTAPILWRKDKAICVFRTAFCLLPKKLRTDIYISISAIKQLHTSENFDTFAAVLQKN